MTTRASALRKFARRRLRHAISVFPESRSEWAKGMENELEYVEDDFKALRWAAGCALASYIEGRLGMDQGNNSFGSMVRKPSAFLPLAMSVTALAMLGGAYIFGVATGHEGLIREPDEGAVAHLWQLLMAGQLPVLAFFAIKWLPRAPKRALFVLGIQLAAVLAAMAPVYFLHL